MIYAQSCNNFRGAAVCFVNQKCEIWNFQQFEMVSLQKRGGFHLCIVRFSFKAGCSDFKVQSPHPLLRIRTFLAITVIQPQYQKEKSFPSLLLTNLFIFQKKRLKKKRKPKSNWTLCLNQPVSS